MVPTSINFRCALSLSGKFMIERNSDLRGIAGSTWSILLTKYLGIYYYRPTYGKYLHTSYA